MLDDACHEKTDLTLRSLSLSYQKKDGRAREYNLWCQQSQILKSWCHTKRRMGKTLRFVFSWLALIMWFDILRFEVHFHLHHLFIYLMLVVIPIFHHLFIACRGWLKRSLMKGASMSSHRENKEITRYHKLKWLVRMFPMELSQKILCLVWHRTEGEGEPLWQLRKMWCAWHVAHMV